jgi:hypothetical protein
MTQRLASFQQPCLKVSQCVSICLKVSTCISMCLKLSHVVSKVSQSVSMCLKLYQSVSGRGTLSKDNNRLNGGIGDDQIDPRVYVFRSIKPEQNKTNFTFHTIIYLPPSPRTARQPRRPPPCCRNIIWIDAASQSPPPLA